MFSVRTLLLTLFAISATQSDCKVGTLSCVVQDGQAVPKICDFFNFYSLNEAKDQCIQKTIDNCVVGTVPNQTRVCFQCSSGYVLDLQTGTCVIIPDASKVDNCDHYSNSPIACDQCSHEFYMSGAACLAIGDKPVTNCQHYSSATECRHCADGSYLSNNQCLVFPEIANCHLYRNLDCDRCENKYLADSSLSNTFSYNVLNSHAFNFVPYVQQNMHFEYWTDDFTTPPCAKGEILNCLQYTSPSTCATCEDGFYLNSAFKCIHHQKTPIKGCDIYYDENTCIACAFEYYLNLNDNTCTPATVVESCVSYNRTQNACIECKETHTVNLVEGNFTCILKPAALVASKISYCIPVTVNLAPNTTEQCPECIDGYKLTDDRTQCLISIENCMFTLPSAGLEPYNTCYKCNPGFYLNTLKSFCISNSLADCEQAGAGTAYNKCIVCSEGKYRSLDYKCVNITNKTNCFKANPFKDECLECDPLFFLADGKCLATNSRSSSVIDQFCESNRQFDNSSACDSCLPGYIPLQASLAAVSATFLTTNHCVRINHETGLCSQCVENSSGNGTSCNAPVASRTDNCMQMVSGYFGSDMNNNCAKCRNEETHYLDSATNSCVSRPAASQVANCAIYLVGNNGCQTCATGFFPNTSTSFNDSCRAVNLIPNFSAITDCAIYNSADGKCNVCLEGKVLSADKLTCVTNATAVSIFFDVNMNLVSAPAVTVVDGCTRYAQLDLGQTACVSCAETHVKIVNLTSQADFKYVLDLHKGIGTGSLALPAEKCVLRNLSYKSDNMTNNAEFKCDTAVETTGVSGYKCLKCMAGFRARLVTFTKDSNGANLAKPVLGVGHCDKDFEMKQTLLGLGNHMQHSANHVPLATFIPYTSCGNDNGPVLFNSIVTNTGHVEFAKSKKESYDKLMKCVIKDNDINFFTPIPHFIYADIPNCQVFAFSTQTNLNNNYPDLCLACKPNTFPVLQDGTSRIRKCEESPLCGENGIVLNGCSTATHGFKLVNGAVNYRSVMLSAGSITNCLVYSEDMVTCAICNNGFSYINGACVDVKNDFATYNCKKSGFGANALSLVSAANTNMLMMNFMFLLESGFSISGIFCDGCDGRIGFITEPDYSATLGSMCKTCDMGFVNVSSVMEFSCTTIDEVPPQNKTAFCLEYAYTTPPVCSKCASTHLLNVTTYQCVEKTTFPNCVSIGGAAISVCQKCSASFALDNTNQCVASNCARTYNGMCSLCNDGFKFVAGSKTLCEENTNTSDTCLAYSPQYGTCGKCKNGDQLYVFFFNGSAGAPDSTQFICEPLLKPLSNQGWSGYNLDETFIGVVFGGASSKMQHLMINSDELKIRLFSNNNPAQSPAASHCFPERDLGKFNSDFSINGIACLKCQIGFTFDPATLSCAKTGAVANCAKYLTNSECLLCEPTHYLLDATTCMPYSDTLTCPKFHSFKDECFDCRDETFLPIYNCQHENGCLKFKENFDGCLECLEGYTHDPVNDICYIVTTENCDVYDTLANKCTKCNAGFWLDVTNSNICKPVDTVANCTVYHATKNECLHCDSQHFQENGVCEDVTTEIDNCIRYISNGVCALCTTIIDLDNGTCFGGNVEGCDIYQDPDTCLKCDSEHYFVSATSCVEYSSDLFCLTFEITKDECIDCPPGFILQATKKCLDSNPSDSCLTKVDNVCTECKIGFVLNDATKICDARTAQNCDSEKKDKDECEVCLDMFWMNADDANMCKPITAVEGCISYYHDKDQCQFCNSTKFLEDGQCKPVTVTVANCTIYIADGVCSVCVNSYELVDSKCERGNIANCEVHTSDTVCSKCDAGFFLKNPDSCVPYSTDLNCLNFEVSLDQCVDCNENYFLNAMKKCEIRDFNLNCLEFLSTANLCVSCLPGFLFVPETSTCTPRTNMTCLTFEKEIDECITCEETKWLNASKVCQNVTNVEGCATYKDTSDACETCDPTKFLNGLVCSNVVTTENNCKVYSGDGICSECADTFALSGTTCVPGSLSNCVVYVSTTECKTCTENTHYLSAPNVCSLYTPNIMCDDFNPAADSCITCQDEHALNTVNICIDIPIDPNCNTFFEDKCTICNDGFFLDDATKVCKLSTTENCETVSTTENECETCAKEFWKDASDSNKCKPVTQDEFCLEYEIISDDCKFCETTKVVKDGKCEDLTVFIAGCLVYNDDNTCHNCAEFLKYTDGKCVAGTTEHCLKYNTNLCEECVDGYFLNNIKTCNAYSTDLNCDEFNKTADKCVSCHNDYTLDGNFKCVTTDANAGCKTPAATTGDCEVCKDDFLLNSLTKDCEIRTAANCESDKPNEDECLTCETKHWMDKGECKESTTVYGCAVYSTIADECAFCETDRFPLNGLCFELTNPVNNCLFYSANGTCDICVASFDLADNQCNGSGTIPNCQNYASETTCQQCKSGYFMPNNTTCTAYTPTINCKTFHPNLDQCIDCNTGFALDDQMKCVSQGPVANCATPAANQIDCDVCNDGFLLTAAKTCVPRQATNCATVQPTVDECLTCLPNFYMDAADSNKCKAQTVADCIEYTPGTTTCVKCDVAKFLDGNVCKDVTTPVDNCKYYSGDGVCSDCQDTFVLNGNVCDSGSIENCLTYSSASVCTLCDPTHFLESATKCTLYSADLNCKTFDPSKDECADCITNYFLSLTGKCTPYDMTKQCLIWETRENKCKTCADTDLMITPDMSCVTRTAKFCATHHATLDQCDKCIALHFRTTTICEPSTVVENCEVYSQTTDACESCSMGFSKSGTACAAIPAVQQVQFCKIHSSPGVCSTCLLNYFFVSSSKCSPGLIPHCEKFTSAHVCTECKTGYYKEDSATCTPYTAGLGCATFNLVNDRCLTCPENKIIDSVGACMDVPINFNCLTFEKETADCEVCKAGFVLNVITKDCETRTAINCAEVEPLMDECKTCNAMHWKDANDLNKCKAVTPITNCNEYEAASNACKSCKSGFYLSEGQCLTVTTPVPNCQAHATATTCSLCDSGYVLGVPTSCAAGSIVNCKIYTSATVCATCEDNHFLKSANECIVYSADLNCEVKNTTMDQCTSCVASRFLDANFKCADRTVATNCKTPEISLDQCITCNANSYLKSDTKTCESFTAVGCDIRSTIANECVTCVSTHYHDTLNHKCEQYTPVDNCDQFYPNEDLCQFCATNHYMDLVSNICRPNPDGIEGCVKYSDLDVCETCKTGFFLSANTCNVVTAQIANCKHYTDTTSCSECTQSHYLTDATTCTPTNLSNCEILFSTTICKKCKPGFVLFRTIENDVAVLKCVPSGITNCILAIGGVSKTCMKCSGDMIPSLDRKSCVAQGASTPIENCALYSEEDQCLQCSPNFARAADCKSCAAITATNRVDTHCSSEVRVKSLKCDSCQMGYHKNFSDVCVPCGGQGCAFCQGTVCQMCREGFFMDSKGVCELISGTNTIDNSIEDVLNRAFFALMISVLVWMR